MSGRIPYLSFSRNGIARIVGVMDPVGVIDRKVTMVATARGWRNANGWVWRAGRNCPDHLRVDLGWQPRRGQIVGKLYDLHAPFVRAAYSPALLTQGQAQ